MTENELNELLKEPEKYIPEGIYCYSFSRNNNERVVKLCPFWE